MSIADLLKAQRRAGFVEDIAGDEDRCALLVFRYQDGYYAVDLQYVREVVEASACKPYPISLPGHFGIINIRSKILPVLAPIQLTNANQAIEGDKVLLLEFVEDQPLCLIVKSVQKLLVAREQCSYGHTINLKEKPVKYIDQSYFVASATEAA